MNYLEKSRAQQIIHGVPYKPRNKQPSMFEILSWNDMNQENDPYGNRDHHEESHKKQLKKLNQKENYSVQEKQNYKAFQKNTSPKINFATSPHKYKHQLYMYNDQQRKTNHIIQDATKKILKQNQSSNKLNLKNSQRSKSKSLNPDNEEDLLEIKNRKNKIKNFKMLSRELPDSAFTTYFGKPAFSNYGSGSTSTQKKSFNVMPHAGKNHPQYQQSYEGALKKGKQINTNHVPKKPIQIYHPQNNNFQHSDYYEIPIKKPNLINSNRFTQDKSYLERKARTPKHNQLNSLSARQSFHKEYHLKTSHDSLNKKLNKAKSLKTFEQQKNQYPLVQSRDHLREILDEKKRQQHKIAYKVTQCYPLASQNCDKQCATRCSRWNQMPPAGIKSPRSDHANDVFYPNKIWT